jgi:hypothetical protein
MRIDSDHVEDLTMRCAAVLAALPPATVVSGLTAARLHDLWLPPRSRAAPLDFTVVASDRASRSLAHPRHLAFTAHRRQLGVSDVRRVGGLPVTTVARTWRDLCAVLPLPDAVAVGDSALRVGTSIEQLARQCEAVRGRPGARCAVTALGLLHPRSRSRPESHMRVALAHPDLPIFAVNAAVFDELGQWLAEPDLSLAAARLALEYQGADHADPKRMRRDMTRVTELRRAGWEVLLYGPAEVLRRPELIAVEVRSLLARRAPQLLRR